MHCVCLWFLILSFILLLSKSLGDENVSSKLRLKNDTLQHLNDPDDNLFSINSLQPLSSLSDEKDASKKSISPFNLHAKLTSESLLRENTEGSCEIYVGETCAQFVGNEKVYIPYPMTQKLLEEKLMQAFGVINISKDLSANCAVYAKPSLCYSAFPICRDLTNSQTTSSISSESFNALNSDPQDNTSIDDDDDDDDNLSQSKLSYGKSRRISRQSNSQIRDNENFLSRQYELTKLKKKKLLNQKLRRICRNQCELLENELCRKEYAIAKRHPLLGQQVPLVECSDLPLAGSKESNDCLSVGIKIVNNAQENDYCYYKNGETYRGVIKTSATGKSCLPWSNQFNLQISNYVESLAGGHSYCRNPGGYEPQPWCYVDANNKMTKEPCNIPKCTIDRILMTWIYPVLGIFLLLSIIIIAFFYFRCYRARKLSRRSSDSHLPGKKLNVTCDQNIYDGRSNTSQPIEMTSLLTSLGNLNDTKNSGIITMSSVESRVSANQIPQYSRDDVVFVKELGEGAFGKVYKGQLFKKEIEENIFVAVKTLKENATQKTQNDFKREVDLMTDLRHSNIICLLGVVLRGEQMCMLFEYMTHGDLHEFLINHSPKDLSIESSSNEILGQAEFLKISSQIAAGMEYLAGNHYVHRDLAARNCLVGDNLIVKISDFGLSRDIYSSDYYRVQSKSLLPVRWMPPESILYGKFATESDIWSFGVVLWEIYSYGLQPYYGYNNQEVIYMIRSRQLLPCPEDCPTMIYSLMIECWHEVANRRPNFTEIHNRLSNWYVNQTYLTSPKNSSKIGSPVVFINNKITESQDNINNHTEQINVNLNDVDVESKINKPYLQSCHN